MTGPGVELDVAATTRIAEQLARATVPLATTGAAARAVPQAGPGTGAVATYLDAVARAAGGFVQATDGLAGLLREAVTETQREDEHGATQFSPPPTPTPTPTR